MNDSLSIRSTSMSITYFSPKMKKSPPTRSPERDDSQEKSASRYCALVPMKGLTSTRTKPLNPLQIYYKNMDVLRIRKKEKGSQKVLLPPIMKTEPEHTEMDELAHKSFFTTNTKEGNSPMQRYEDAMSGKGPLEAAKSEYFNTGYLETAIPQALHKDRSTQRITSLEKKFKKDGGDGYIDAKRKQEFRNFDKRTKKTMELRTQNYYQNKSKYLSQYLGSNAKAQVSEIYSSFSPSFISPRNEYPILG